MAPPTIILTTANARYAHCAFGLRYLLANLGPLRTHAAIREFTLSQPPLEIAEALLADAPRLIGLGVYIWNIDLLTRVVQTIKTLRPDITLVIGGPEASHEFETTAIFAAADYLVRGEGERSFRHLAEAVLAGQPPAQKIIEGDPPDLRALDLPYDTTYSHEDLTKRLVYVETSRGCPFRCAFCLSALDHRVREFPVDRVLPAIARLIERGARRLMFVDRTFNLDPARVRAVLTFLLDHWEDGLCAHFEILPDRLTPEIVERFAAFPPGGLYLEIGLQTFSEPALEAIGRAQDLQRTEDLLRLLGDRTRARLHVDLVIGLPGETRASLATGFDRLVRLAPHEIQVGFLKRLKGTPLAQTYPPASRTAAPPAILFAPHPPYEVLQTPHLDFLELQRLKRFARFFDLYYNSGNFPQTLALLWQTQASPFEAFMALSEALWAAEARTHELPLVRLAQHAFTYLSAAGVHDIPRIAAAIRADYHRLPGRKERLDFLPPA